MPAAVWVWTTQARSWRAMWIAEWIVNPAAFTSFVSGPSSTTLPSPSIFTRSLARISWKWTP
jgi:hypothetical protein